MTITTVAATSSPELGQNAIEHASSQNKWLFIVYMLLLGVTAVLTYLLWKSGNDVQSAIVTDANARIAEATEIAAKANERSKTLERDNLRLRADVNTQTGQVAGLQKDAEDAKSAQAAVQIELEKQRERTAKAETNLLTLQQAIKFRHLSADQKRLLRDALKDLPKISPRVSSSMSQPDAAGYAQDFAELFSVELGWPVPPEQLLVASYAGEFEGILIAVHDRNSVPVQVPPLLIALKNAGIDAKPSLDGSVPPTTFELKVGMKTERVLQAH